VGHERRVRHGHELVGHGRERDGVDHRGVFELPDAAGRGVDEALGAADLGAWSVVFCKGVYEESERGMRKPSSAHCASMPAPVILLLRW
jgi:hypothetical protein